MISLLKIIHFVIVALCSLYCGHAWIILDEEDSKLRIIGGENTPKMEFSFMASVQVKNNADWEHICGGTLIGRKDVLTAASCFDPYDLDVDKFSVVLGAHNILDIDTNEPSRQRVDVVNVILHPKHPLSSLKYDITALKLNQDANDEFTPLKLTGRPGYCSTDSCHILGWGSKNFGGSKLATVLQNATATLISAETCPNDTDIHGVMCVENKVSSTCTTDSGGPLFCCDKVFDKNCNQSVYSLVGVASQVEVPCNKAPFAPFTFVGSPEILGFIKDKKYGIGHSLRRKIRYWHHPNSVKGTMRPLNALLVMNGFFSFVLIYYVTLMQAKI